MHPLAVAGTAAQKAYICTPCLRRLAVGEVRSLSRRPLVPQHAKRTFSCGERRFQTAEARSEAIQDASAHKEKAPKSVPPKQQDVKEQGNGQAKYVSAESASITNDGTTSPKKSKQATKSGKKRDGAQEEKSPASNSKEVESKKPKDKDGGKKAPSVTKGKRLPLQEIQRMVRSVDLNTPQDNSQDNPQDKSEKPSKKPRPPLTFKGVEYQHTRLNRKLKAMQKIWSGSSKATSRISRRLPHDIRMFTSNYQFVKASVAKLLDEKYPSGTEQHAKLVHLSNSLARMADAFNDTSPSSTKLSWYRWGNRQNLALSGARALRRGKALQKLILASGIAQGEKASAEGASFPGLEESDVASSMQTLLSLLPDSGHIISLSVSDQQTLSSILRRLVPDLDETEHQPLLLMLADHIHERTKLKEVGIDYSKVAPHYTLEEVLKEQALRSASLLKQSVVKPQESKPAHVSKPKQPTPMIKPTSFKSLSKELINNEDLALEPYHIEQAPVRHLAYGLDRVLFNSGVSMLQDKRSRVYNFDPYLEHIMPVQEFNFDLLPGFVTSSKDASLQAIATSRQKKYTGSSSSMTGMLSHFHYILSKFRPLNHKMMSRSFKVADHHAEFTSITKGPSAVMLRWKPDEGLYAIDADKEFDEMNALSLLGNSLERLLTLPTENYEKFRIGSKDEITDEEKNAPETYHYTGFGDILMRSQLDAHDPRLPGTGMFDLKTRAVVPVRMDVQQYLSNSDYEIRHMHGSFESYEREFMDMTRATMLKYMLQVRIGRMDGIFVAYHNTKRIFGFQYIPVEDLDLVLHGQSDRTLGDEEFKLSLKLLNTVLNKVTEKFPETSVGVHMAAVGGQTRTKLYIFAEPFTEEEADSLQVRNEARNKAIVEDILSGRAPTYDENGNRIFPQANGDAPQKEPVKEPSEEKVDFVKAVETEAESETSATTADVTEEEEEDSKPELTASAEIAEDTSKSSEADDLSEKGEQPDGDSAFLDSIDGELASFMVQSKSPLLAMELTLENFVNRKPVRRPGFDPADEPADRLEDVSETFSTRKGDKWTVSYELKEISDQQTAWRMYLQTKQKRKSLIDFERDQSDLAFIRKVLKKYIEKGRAYREERDKADGPDPAKVMWRDIRTVGADELGSQKP